MKLEYFDLLSGEPLFIEGIGNIKQPALYDIKHLGFENYDTQCRYLAVDLQNFLNITNLKEQYDSLSEEDKKIYTLFNLIIATNEFIEIYKQIFSFFIGGEVEFDEELRCFVVWNETQKSVSKLKNIVNRVFKLKPKTSKKNVSGFISNDNFDNIRDCLLQINYLKSVDEKPEKYKNERARKIAEKLAKGKAEQDKNKNGENLSLAKMISKYCADNKNGINILNVWDMTIYQFYDQFSQHNYIRQSFIQDMVYSNTVSFSDLKAYDSQLWLK